MGNTKIETSGKTATKKTTTKPKTTKTANKEVEPKKKVFAPNDMIPCVSITPGEMFFIGGKTEDIYSFADLNDVTEIAFQDLDYAAKRKSSMIFDPFFVIQDEDFVELFPKLNEVYEKLYTTQDLKEVLEMSARKIAQIVPTLPAGAQNALKSLVITEIDRGRYSDIQKIKVFDDIFETDMLSRALNVN